MHPILGRVRLLLVFFLLLSLTGCGGSGGGGSGGGDSGGPVPPPTLPPLPPTVRLTSLEVSPAEITLARGTSGQLRVVGRFSNGSSLELTERVAWSSSGAAVTVSDDGEVRAVEVGSASVTASLEGVSASSLVTVSSATLTELEVATATSSIPLGTTAVFVATGRFSDGSSQDLSGTVSWSSSAPAVASVDAQGVARGLSVGEAEIAGQFAGQTASASLLVTNATLRSLAITPEAPRVVQRATQQLRALGTYTDGTVVDMTSSVEWSSDNEGVAVVAPGGLLRGGVFVGAAEATTVVSASRDGLRAETTVAVVLGSGSASGSGNNPSGELGAGHSSRTYAPVAMSRGALPDGVSLVEIAAGYDHCVAIGSDGKLYSWGRNSHGQLGNGTYGWTPQTSPSAVSQGAIPPGTRFIAVSVGNFHCVALSADGKLYSWGSSLSGGLGDGSTTMRDTPVAVALGGVPEGVRFTAIASGFYHNLALGDDGKLYSWGENYGGQLGDGSYDNRLVPVAVGQGAVPDGATFTAIACGDSHCLALADNGSLYAWGVNNHGQLGSAVERNVNLPVAVNLSQLPAGTVPVAIQSASASNLLLTSEGKLFSWGFNESGGLGNGSTVSVALPSAVSVGEGPDGYLAMSVGSDHSLALGRDGKLYAWGGNRSGQLGDGTTFGWTVPRLWGEQGRGAGGSQVTLFVAGGEFSLVLSLD